MTVPVFVQPNSEQQCLLGMNAIPLLRIEVKHSDGEPILVLDQNTPAESARVNLVGAVSIPAQKGKIVRARISSPESGFNDRDVLFEPNH